MRLVSGNELSRYKILPFDLYDSNRNKILAAGEVLTPGKVIMLKNHVEIFTEDLHEELDESYTATKKTLPKSILNFSYSTLDTSKFQTVINKDLCVNMDEQIKIKYFFKCILDLIKAGYYEESLLKISSLIQVLLEKLLLKTKQNTKGSRLRFLGEYEFCHPLNVAIISGMIAKKISYTPLKIEQVMLAALLHDIGKFKYLSTNPNALITTYEDEVEKHTYFGYKMLMEDFELPEQIALPALEHHENNDGTGYPQGLSNDYINEYSQIVNVANYYDNLAFNRINPDIIIKNTREALRAMLEIGTTKFSAKILYTFIHMFSYDDINNFDDMSI